MEEVKKEETLCERCLFSYEGIRYTDGTRQLLCSIRAVDPEVTLMKLDRCAAFVKNREWEDDGR